MKTQRFLFFITIVFLWFPLKPATGAELKGVPFPEKVDFQGVPLQLNGLGLRVKTVFKAQVYVAALYVRTKSTDSTTIIRSADPKQIDLVFMRDVGAEDIINSWNEGFENNCPGKCDSLVPRLQQLNSLMVDMKKGQKISLSFSPEKLILSTPGKQAQAIEGRDFSDMVLATFIGEVPPTKQLKQGLLGAN